MPHSPFTLPDPRDLVPVSFPYDWLSRWPDPAADNLFAFDATDRLLVDMAAPAIREAASGSVVVMGDRYGALTLAVASLDCPGARGIRCHQDAYGGRMALQANFESLADPLGLEGTSADVFQACELDESLLAGAEVVLMQLPKDLAQLDHWASFIAAYAGSSVKVFAGGRIKHMTRAMNEVLERHFGHVSASLARQKSRVLLATEPRRGIVPGIETRDGVKRDGSKQAPGQSLNQSPEPCHSQSLSDFPESVANQSLKRICLPARLLDESPSEYYDPELKLWVCSYPGSFAAGRVDIGTRFLIPFIEQMPRRATGTAADLGCGTGLLTATLLRSHPEYHVIATDRSAVAVRSAKATLRRNGFEPLLDGSVEDEDQAEAIRRRDGFDPASNHTGAVRYEVRQDHALFQQPDASLDLVVCNPPFHSEASVSTSLAEFLLREAARTLRPGGIMLTVFNSHLQHRRALQRLVGPTEQLGRNQKFTVTRTVRF